MGLTIKQENFAREYVKTGNASEAYRQAYDAENMSDKDIGNEAYDLVHHPEVAPYIDKLKEKLSKKYEITVESITKEFEIDRNLARQANQMSAAIKATEHIAKMHGVYVEKTKQEVDLTPTTRIIIENAREDTGKNNRESDTPSV